MKIAILISEDLGEKFSAVSEKTAAQNPDLLIVIGGKNVDANTAPVLCLPDQAEKQPDSMDINGIRFFPVCDKNNQRLRHDNGRIRFASSSYAGPMVVIQKNPLDTMKNKDEILDSLKGFGTVLLISGAQKTELKQDGFFRQLGVHNAAIAELSPAAAVLNFEELSF